jgi:hypothetical protein
VIDGGSQSLIALVLCEEDSENSNRVIVGG